MRTKAPDKFWPETPRDWLRDHLPRGFSGIAGQVLTPPGGGLLDVDLRVHAEDEPAARYLIRCYRPDEAPVDQLARGLLAALLCQCRQLILLGPRAPAESAEFYGPVQVRRLAWNQRLAPEAAGAALLDELFDE